MTSEERREARYRRRRARRAENRRRRLVGLDMEHVADVGSLYRSACECARGVGWKCSTQRYMERVLPNVARASRDLLEGNDVRRGLTHFDLWERGKLRHISAVRFPERVCHKSLSQNALVPAIVPTLTAGCSANIRGRGTDYAIRRLKGQLVDHVRRHGSDGWVLLVDFEDYFASIGHDVAKGLVARSLDDERVVRLACDVIDSHPRGLGLGSEPNQIVAVALPSPIDHMAESMVEATGRYMDDSYYVSCDKEALWELLGAIERMCGELGLTINRRKTRVMKLSKGFTFLKRRFRIAGGKVIVRPSRDCVTRERRRLRKHAAMVSDERMTYAQASQSYQSWRGMMLGMDAHETVTAMDRMFSELIGRGRHGRQRAHDARG